MSSKQKPIMPPPSSTPESDSAINISIRLSGQTIVKLASIFSAILFCSGIIVRATINISPAEIEPETETTDWTPSKANNNLLD